MKKNKQLDTLIADIYEKVEILGRGEAIDVSVALDTHAV